MGTQFLQPRALCEAIADRVRERILCYDLKPGEAVNEGELAQAYGVSRTPVREALKLLHHEGLLTAHPRRGMTVTVLSEPQLAEAVQLHHLLCAYAHQHGVPSVAASWNSMLNRMLEMTERRLQLGYGPEFRHRLQAIPSQ
ncbi:GntR family transcriptional regulator [Giesbergeria anulus]|uniref:Regulatory protein, gntR family n=1 Tax=Giesbergeria anulus TaxID=180197 RepID=A0A1H9HH56_9BURK|nr:GntR family transcriptional regulator [Giesbergeria anulus]SEQ61693.1 regulatory protein, gntR family [Giesbergeria anulus]